MVSRASRTWSPSHYMKFSSERLRPALDLLQQVRQEGCKNVVDLGCGTGNILPFFQHRWPHANVFCVDSSREMLEQARKEHTAQLASGTYVHCDFESFDLPNQSADVIFSNAALHWVSFEIHKTLLPRLISILHSGGELAFQMPDTRYQASHRLMTEAAQNLGLDVSAARHVTTEVDAEAYYSLLSPLCSSLNIWGTEYIHVLEGEDPVFAFTSSTGFAPFVAAVGPRRAERYAEEYKRLLREAYPRQADGKTLFPFRRFFVVARKESR